jgi:hypothetical protein
MTSIGVAVIVLCIPLIGCTTGYPKEAHEALVALRKVQAATQVGVTYQQYGSLLIDAQDKVNGALRVLHDGPLRSELNETMQAYKDASDAWSAKIKGGNDGLTDSIEPGKTLISKYSLATTNIYGQEVADPDQALLVMWSNADFHLQKVADRLDPPKGQ